MSSVKNIAQFELKSIQSDFPKEKITSSKESVKYCRRFYGDDISIYESFFIVLMNRNSTVVGFAKISQGGIAGTVVDIRIVLQYAMQSMATNVIVCHNHPSGSITPSREDKAVTQRLKKSLKELLDCTLMDHIIITETESYSFAEKGEL